MMWLSLALAGRGFATLGHRIDSDSPGMGVSVTEEWVVGPDGRVSATHLAARYATPTWSGAVVLPFATFPSRTVHQTGLGNLRLEGNHYRDVDQFRLSIGGEIHLPTSTAYTYTNDAVSLWPGGGASAVLQASTPLMKRARLLVRGSVGINGTANVAPFPGATPSAIAAGGLDLTLTSNISLYTESSLAVWDPNPFEWMGMARYQLGAIRLGAGLHLPFGAWLGGSPSNKPAGIREATLRFDLAAAVF